MEPATAEIEPSLEGISTPALVLHIFTGIETGAFLCDKVGILSTEPEQR
jgi:hypothetical protein